MKIIKEQSLGWYKILTKRNLLEKAARNLLVNNMSKKKLVKSLIAQHYTVEAAKKVVKNIIICAQEEHKFLSFNGYILVKSY